MDDSIRVHESRHVFDTAAQPAQEGAIEDLDGDSYRASIDCDDANGSVYPGAPEACDGLDNDCDGEVDEGLDDTHYRDADADGYGNPQDTVDACTRPDGFVNNGDDCDDDSDVCHPGATEVCDGLDNDCNGVTDDPCLAD